MRTIFLVLLATAVAGTVWDDFKQQYERTFETPAAEAEAEACFMKNLALIAKRNAAGFEEHGINQFTDICPDDFNKMYLNYQAPQNSTLEYMPPLSDDEIATANAANASVDWRTRGAVTPVKNQGQCGSCWTFSTTGNIEGQWFLAGHRLVSLSEQELVSCATTAGHGCQGGSMDAAFRWVKEKGGITSEANYPYTSGHGVTGSCKRDRETPIAAKISGSKRIASSETTIAAQLARSGPLSIAVDAQRGWQTYRGGIMHTCYGKQLDHGVLLVGYGQEGSTRYWIVKNSWTSSWGEHGYIRLARGSDQCGMTSDVTTSIV
eukprot:TRINITY_DN9602_c0_g2_i1.p1 TRINITY_DN9602_c0_g2~~TRINITY_DN9602_c0_g2_i1.p1  ORF type:complete len:320 (-),score=65.93 TRINITY_DN9602_c0_g2_i1:87-1046(-)